MTIFANRVQTAYYDDASYSTITIEYSDRDNQVLRTYGIPVNENNSDYRALMDDEGYTLERLALETEKYKRRSSKAFNLAINTAAKELAQQMAEQMAEKMIEQRIREEYHKINERLNAEGDASEEMKKTLGLDAAPIDIMDVVKTILSDEVDKEELFKFKLAVFELPKIQEIQDRDVKRDLRKASTYREVLRILIDHA